jgi:hypothetical protein
MIMLTYVLVLVTLLKSQCVPRLPGKRGGSCTNLKPSVVVETNDQHNKKQV